MAKKKISELEEIKIDPSITIDTRIEYWQPTMGLRWCKKTHPNNHIAYRHETVLQQRWINNKGEEKWIDVPLHEEE
jgi:hypothetical protein